MGKKSKYTTNTQIKSALRQLFLRSREHAATLKRDNYSCVKCGAKKSVAKGREVKVNVHHMNGVKWAKIIEYIRMHLLVDPSDMETLCKSCHADSHKINEKGPEINEVGRSVDTERRRAEAQ